MKSIFQMAVCLFSFSVTFRLEEKVLCGVQLFTYLLKQSDEELRRREEEEQAQMEVREREMFRERLRQQRLESEADSKWLQQEEQNIQLPFSPPPV